MFLSIWQRPVDEVYFEMLLMTVHFCTIWPWPNLWIIIGPSLLILTYLEREQFYRTVHCGHSWPSFMQETRSIKEIFSPIFTSGDKTASEREKNAESCRRCFTADEKNSFDTNSLVPLTIDAKTNETWSVMMAQMVERSHSQPGISGSYPTIGKLVFYA